MAVRTTNKEEVRLELWRLVKKTRRNHITADCLYVGTKRKIDAAVEFLAWLAEHGEPSFTGPDLTYCPVFADGRTSGEEVAELLCGIRAVMWHPSETDEEGHILYQVCLRSF